MAIATKRVVGGLAAIGLMAALATGGAAVPAASAAVTASQAHPDALYGVSCTSLVRCMAVGNRAVAAPGGNRPLAESWNGTTWRVVPMPDPATLVRTQLSAVSCKTRTDCVAVGYHYGPANTEDLAEQWNGSTWRIIASSSPFGNGGMLNDVSCRNRYGCFAVGDYNTGTGASLGFAELWAQGRWHALKLAVPSGARVTDLAGISCSGRYCMAVGAYADASGSLRRLAYTWTGSAWTLRLPTSPVSSSQPNTALFGVSCAAPALCMAVGYTANQRQQLPFTELWAHGRWRTVLAGLAAGGVLIGVSCPGLARCVAVGSASGKPLIQAWSGTRWRVQRAAMARGQSSGVLFHLSCRTQSARCIAVGLWSVPGTSNPRSTLAEAWTGRAWAVMTTMNP